MFLKKIFKFTCRLLAAQPSHIKPQPVHGTAISCSFFNITLLTASVTFVSSSNKVHISRVLLTLNIKVRLGVQNTNKHFFFALMNKIQ